MPISQTMDKNQARLELMEHIDAFVYQFRFDLETSQFSFPFASNAFMETYGVSESETYLGTSPAITTVYREDRSLVEKSIISAIKSITPWQCDFRIKESPRVIKWHRGIAKPIVQDDGSYLWTGYMHDITEQKKAERDLFESKQRLQFALEGSQDGVWDWDVSTNEVFYSDTSLKMVGFNRDEVPPIANFWNDKVHPDDINAYYADIRKHFKGETPYYINEHRILCKDATYKWILDRGKVIARTKRGVPLRVIGTHSDISLQKAREKELINNIKTIENQNSRLMNFAHIVSHNLKSHAGNFKSLLRMMDETDDTEEKLGYSSYLFDVSSGLTETIDHLNEIIDSQEDIANNLCQLNLWEYIEKAVQVHSGDIQIRKAIVRNGVPRDIFINYIPAYLESILLNLISNALKYQDEDRDPVISIDTIIVDEQLILQVTDNGLGLDLSKFGKRLFGMYQTFHGNEDAKGIGLFITKNQLTEMGDDIVARSEVGAGSRFQVTFNKKLSHKK